MFLILAISRVLFITSSQIQCDLHANFLFLKLKHQGEIKSLYKVRRGEDWMFLIAGQKETVKERGSIGYLQSQLPLEGVEVVCRGCCYLRCSTALGWHGAGCCAAGRVRVPKRTPADFSRVQRKHLFSCQVESFEETSPAKPQISLRDKEVMRGKREATVGLFLCVQRQDDVPHCWWSSPSCCSFG